MSGCFGIERENKFPKNVIRKIVDYGKANSIGFVSAKECSFGILISYQPFFDLYKGVWKGETVFIKKYKLENRCDPEMVFNDIIVGSKMKDQKNVLKFIGCCVKNQENPFSVYEFIDCSNNSAVGTKILGDYYTRMPSISRLKVGMEMAEAISYAHSMDIILQYIPMSTILLDSENVPKLIDFSFAISIPDGCSEVIAKVPQNEDFYGGYYQPSYEQRSRGFVVKKTDIYQLGRLLLYLLIQQDYSLPYFDPGRQIDDDLLNQFQNRLDKAILEEFKNQDHLKRFAKLGFSCIRFLEKDRPELTVVHHQLKEIIMLCSSNTKNIEK